MFDFFLGDIRLQLVEQERLALEHKQRMEWEERMRMEQQHDINRPIHIKPGADMMMQPPLPPDMPQEMIQPPLPPQSTHVSLSSLIQDQIDWENVQNHLH